MRKGEVLPIFVYGTLRRGEKNYRRYLQGRTLSERPARVRGKLFFVRDGGYPYLEASEGEVIGEVMELAPPLYEETLAAIDELEEYDPTEEQGSVYLRRSVEVLLEDGRTLRAWVYFWNDPTIRGEPVPGGDFLHISRS